MNVGPGFQPAAGLRPGAPPGSAAAARKGCPTEALWYKSWRELRGRFYFGLIAATVLAAATAGVYLWAARYNPASVAGDYRALVFRQWFSITLAFLCPVWALMMSGSGVTPQVVWHSLRGVAGGWWALSLPVRRRVLVAIRAGAGAAALAVFILAAALLAVLISPALGHSFDLPTTLELAGLNFAACFAFYGAFVLLAALLDDFWHDIAGYLVLITVLALLSRGAGPGRMIRLLRGVDSFERGFIDWPALAACLALGLLFILAALVVTERRDY